MLLTENITKARDLLAKVSIFEMPPTLVHDYVVVDGMLHGTQPVLSWSKAIARMDTLCAGGCPKKALVKEAQELVIMEQTKAAMAAGTPHLAGNPSPQFKTPPVAPLPSTPIFSSFTAEKNVAPASPAPTETVWKHGPCKVTKVTDASGSFLHVSSPYNVNFISALKTLPIPDRKYVESPHGSSNKAWVIKAVHETWVQSLIQSTFPKA
jgi:hypothetical protein